ASEPSENGPGSHFALSNEHTGRGCTEDQNVQVAQVIAHQEPFCRDRAEDLGFNANYPEDPNAGLLQPAPSRLVTRFRTTEGSPEGISQSRSTQLGQKPGTTNEDPARVPAQRPQQNLPLRPASIAVDRRFREQSNRRGILLNLGIQAL